MGFLIAAALALISVFAMNRSGMLLGDAARVGAVNPVAASQPEESLKTLSAVLAVPDVSTNGTDATSVDLAGALNRADDLLSTGESGDKEEAKYWLRRALAQGLSEKRMVWAMTQLGTLYAAPMSGAPDYAAARSVWELAAAQGDPVALCFLAALHEHGLGVPADEVRALVLYRNAKAEGGCRNVDASIQRLSKGTP
ncbi:MAG: tetratricopeptide repeat protein [Hyphomicrobiaceae bacterium]